MVTANPYRITAVCLGNICRSPMAEVVLQERIRQAGFSDLVQVDSAGTGDWHVGYPADERAQGELARSGYSPATDHKARQIINTWMSELDLIVAMDSSNYTNVQDIINQSGHAPELVMFRSFDPELAHLDAPHPDLDVPDPYYGTGDGFTVVLNMIERATDGLITQLPARLDQRSSS
jgi:protein-tyrosine phosphatase